ncbi:hypothetical protein [Blastococcus sp. TF02A-26]|uniref:hypothetical protein n=1 Tax=Blastococcus sp. TF02A-26 TaxID=2250577 RepID=UPI000DE8082F|nr:hypothetical protein [Blastococcus sp. TF02A-26]RBY81837.1 hypothetical protein DQ240_20185 [Blastococcus sp. TF02A-26]
MTTVVLLEGRSDVAAVRAVARTSGLADDACRLVDMGGVTGIRRHLEVLDAEPGVRVLGMCDAGEVAVVVRALGVRGAVDLPAHGFTVCDTDLEDELIRALGPERVVDVLDRLGLTHRLAVLQNQPAWRGRPLPEQLHRFAGTTSGRKELLAGALAAELTVAEVPAPLRALVTWIADDRVAPA